MAFEDFSEKYLDAYVRVENKSVSTQTCLIKNLARHFQNRYLHQISALDIREYMAARLDKVSPSSVNRSLAAIKCMFNRAIEWGIVSNNQIRVIKRLAENNERCRWLNEEEQNRLLS
ncbi:MAG: phage integrase N-terminal SAM-like domain-containing protein [Candidatus Omnitrophica bacterium]|nr:phage integrase N-terminal SAM-like domain-containing protein [Candidatus Omnitrophota bacterium]